MAYRARVLDQVLDELFPHLAAIAIEGAKGVGKTATASERVERVLDLSREFVRDRVAAQPDVEVARAGPVLIDEWQLYPPVWDAVKRAVDADPTGGRILLAGSAGVPSGVRIHSGAGRIVSVTMRPMSMVERGAASPSVSLAGLLSGGRQRVGGDTSFGIAEYAEEIVRSGFPAIRALPPRARDAQLDSYLSRLVERELPESGAVIRRPDSLRKWLSAYGAATSTTASYTTILDAATPGEEDKPVRQTATIYREHLLRLYILDPVEAWLPMFSPLKRLGAAPKHHLVDPALAARLLTLGGDDLLSGAGDRVAERTGSMFGALFESLVTQSVRVYADAVGAKVGHLRTRGGEREVDLIVEGPGNRVVAIEVKLAGGPPQDRDVRHLNWLEGQLGDRLADKVIVTTGPAAYRRRDGVAVVPLSLLGP